MVAQVHPCIAHHKRKRAQQRALHCLPRDAGARMIRHTGAGSHAMVQTIEPLVYTSSSLITMCNHVVASMVPRCGHVLSRLHSRQAHPVTTNLAGSSSNGNSHWAGCRGFYMQANLSPGCQPGSTRLTGEACSARCTNPQAHLPGLHAAAGRGALAQVQRPRERHALRMRGRHAKVVAVAQQRAARRRPALRGQALQDLARGRVAHKAGQRGTGLDFSLAVRYLKQCSVSHTSEEDLLGQRTGQEQSCNGAGNHGAASAGPGQARPAPLLSRGIRKMQVAATAATHSVL